MSYEELVNCLHHGSPQVRAQALAQALAALGSRPSRPDLAPSMTAINDAQNRQTPWFGFIMVSWVGVVALLESGESKAQQLAKELVSQWEPDERQHLISWLKDFPVYAQALAG